LFTFSFQREKRRRKKKKLISFFSSAFGVVALDDCNFHEAVNMDEFEKTKTISFSPPDGESVIMNYRCSGDFTTPFRVFPFLEEVMSSRLDLVLRIRADIPQSLFGNNIVVRVPVPKSTTRFVLLLLLLI
jgi:AP-4 complex subunit mu-1